MAKQSWEPWTVVHKAGFEPVVPIDCNEHTDEGMLVYRSEAAAKVAAKHQRDLYSVPCRAVKLSAVIAHEANVVGKIGPSKIGVKVNGRRKIAKATGRRT